MTEEDARKYLTTTLHVSRETLERLERFVAFLREEAQHQNLISASTIDHIWARHIADSAQLIALAPVSKEQPKWLDLGTGAGFPGLIVGILGGYSVKLVESRARRIDYLGRAIESLALESRVRLAGMPVEKVESEKFDVISARAFAPLQKTLDLAERFSTKNTCWLLPKGRNAVKELEEAKACRRLDLHVVSSVTDGEAGIIVGHLS